MFYDYETANNNRKAIFEKMKDNIYRSLFLGVISHADSEKKIFKKRSKGLSRVSPVLLLIIDLLERAPVTSPSVPATR